MKFSLLKQRIREHSKKETKVEDTLLTLRSKDPRQLLSEVLE